MTLKSHSALVLIVLVFFLTAGCKKDVRPSAVTVNSAAKALQINLGSFHMNTVTGRLTAYDDVNGFNYVLGYDLSNANAPAVIKVNGATLTAAPFFIDNVVPVLANVSTPNLNYAEVGGDHFIAIDYYGTGHYDHLLMYRPGSGMARVLENVGTNMGNWKTIWSSSSGIGGYDLASPQDKIIAYNLGSGFKQALICYRPGNGILWAIQNQATGLSPSNPTPHWVAVIQSFSGLPSFDLNSTLDRVISIDDPVDATVMHLAAYRPGSGVMDFYDHVANANTFTFEFAYAGLGSGVTTLFNQNVRVLPYNPGGSPLGYLHFVLIYEPGDPNIAVYNPGTGGFTFTDLSTLTYPANHDPTVPANNNVGDKIVILPHTGSAMSPLVPYAAGANQVAVIEQNLSGVYADVY